MNIITFYDNLSIEHLEESEEVKEYRREIQEAKDIVNLELSKSVVEKLKNPIKLIKTIRDHNRIYRIEKGLDKIISSNILNSYQETGHLEEDLINAAYNIKPKKVKRYIKNNKINNVNVK